MAASLIVVVCVLFTGGFVGYMLRKVQEERWRKKAA